MIQGFISKYTINPRDGRSKVFLDQGDKLLLRTSDLHFLLISRRCPSLGRSTFYAISRNYCTRNPVVNKLSSGVTAARSQTPYCFPRDPLSRFANHILNLGIQQLKLETIKTMISNETYNRYNIHIMFRPQSPSTN
jgi:hypothetical protein